MADKTVQREAMYCLGCCYRLDHLESSECPECGRGFDRNNPMTSSHVPKPVRAPWECLLAALLLAGLIYLSSDWWALDEFFHRRREVYWGSYRGPSYVPFAKAKMRLEEIAYVVPLLVAIPGLLISAIRHSRGQKLTLLVALLLLLIYAAWPGTWTAYRDLPGAIETIYSLNHLYR